MMASEGSDGQWLNDHRLHFHSPYRLHVTHSHNSIVAIELEAPNSPLVHVDSAKM